MLTNIDQILTYLDFCGVFVVSQMSQGISLLLTLSEVQILGTFLSISPNISNKPGCTELTASDSAVKPLLPGLQHEGSTLMNNLPKWVSIPADYCHMIHH